MYKSLRDLLDEAKDNLQEQEHELSTNPSCKTLQSNVRYWKKEIEEIESDLRFEHSCFNV